MVYYRHKHDTDGSCSLMGKQAEQRFVECLSGLGFLFEPATLEGQFNHKDFALWFRGSVDVKSRKRIRRGDSESQDDYVWIEFVNGRGRKGWLHGKATWIGFETATGFVVVDRTNLVSLCNARCDLSGESVERADQALYKLYRRGMCELSLIKLDDLYTIPHIIINTKGETTHA